MKVLFSGPTLYRCLPDPGGVAVMPPAAHGDLATAVLEGANVIGLVDGLFETTAAVWHKEILFALSEGVAVFGAASMGALRAAECAAFGMVPVGEIAHAYLTGALDDDAAVAVSHGPSELGSPPLTEALVDVEATIGALVAGNHISADQAAHLSATARHLHFKDRTVAALVRDFPDAEALAALYRAQRVSRKTEDALLLVDALVAHPDRRNGAPDWQLENPATWLRARHLLERRRKDAKPKIRNHVGITPYPLS